MVRKWSVVYGKGLWKGLDELVLIYVFKLVFIYLNDQSFRKREKNILWIIVVILV